MKENRVYNFSAGPSMLPYEVLKKAQEQLINYKGSGMSVMEMSHRSKTYDEIIQTTEKKMRSILDIPDNYKVLLLQGGATLQFSMVPLNLLKTGKADYIITGYFAKKAYEEAAKFGTVYIAKDCGEDNYSYIPKQEQLELHHDADYVYLCANNTIYGSEWKYLPDTKGVPIVADMSSNILSKPIDVSEYGVIFAGAQKNMGIAGVTVVIIRDDLLNYSMENTPAMLQYGLLADKSSMYNTPPTYAIYMLGLILDWIEEEGGLSAIQKRNEKKARLLYDYLDTSDFYTTQVRKEDRSLMNVTFRSPNKELDELFVKESILHGFTNLKGHRAVGGMRASIYNAMPIEGVQKLIGFMKEFEEKYKNRGADDES